MRPPLERGLDAAEGAALARSVGWAETTSSLADVLDAAGSGAFHARDEKGALIGMVACVTWGRLAWIGKLVVAEQARRQGLARSLLRRAVAHAEENGAVSIGLDASPMGRDLYEQEGFRAFGESVVWSREGARPRAQPPPAPADSAIYPVSPAEIMELLACDQPRFGANRGPLLAKLMARHPQQAFVAVHRKTGAFTGHVLSWGDRLGPLVADAPATAAWLLHAAERAGVPSKAIVAAWNPDATALFAANGYTQMRACTRMWRGEPLPGRAESIYAIGSFALG